MGFDCGFDIYPRLESSATNREIYQKFLDDIINTYDDVYDEQGARTDGKVLDRSSSIYVQFMVGECPQLPRDPQWCSYFLRFSSKISGRLTSGAESYIKGVCKIAKVHFGSRVHFWHELNEYGDHSQQYGHYNWIQIRKADSELQALSEKQKLSNTCNTTPDSSRAESAQQEDVSKQLLYEERKISSKGVGAVALSSIQPGDLIVSEPPLFKVPRFGNAPEALTSQLADTLRALDRNQQRIFFSLSNNYPKLNAIIGIVKTSAMPLGSAADEGGIFPKCTRFNHSCVSNAHYSWDDVSGCEQVHATRSIMAGEEITVSYILEDVWVLPRSLRQTHLRQNFNFDCACSMCTALPSVVEQSDQRRSKIAALRGDVGDGFHIVTSPAICLQKCHTMLNLLEEEGEKGIMQSSVYYDAFQVCVANGDLARASAFAELAADTHAQCEGLHTDEVAKKRRLAQSPQKHRLFGTSQKWKTSLKSKRPREAEDFESWLWRRSS